MDRKRAEEETEVLATVSVVKYRGSCARAASADSCFLKVATLQHSPHAPCVHSRAFHHSRGPMGCANSERCAGIALHCRREAFKHCQLSALDVGSPHMSHTKRRFATHHTHPNGPQARLSMGGVSGGAGGALWWFARPGATQGA